MSKKIFMALVKDKNLANKMVLDTYFEFFGFYDKFQLIKIIGEKVWSE